MIKKDKTMNINVFDSDDGIKYIRYSDFEKMLKRIKEVHDRIEDDLKLELDREHSQATEYCRRIIKAINFIEHYRDKFHYNLINSHLDKIIAILEGKMYE